MLAMDDLIEAISTNSSRFMHDNFLSTEQIMTAEAATGSITKHPFNFYMETGVQNNSFAKMYYVAPWFNPQYSTLQVKLQMNSMQDVEFYIGFHKAVIDPSAYSALGDIESHAGFLVTGGKLYSTTGNDENHKEIQLTDVDLTNCWLFKIKFDEFWTRPLPQIYPYFDGIRVVKTTRDWALASKHGDLQPENYVHYIISYIKNTTGANKYVELKHITYSEEYAD